MIDTSKIVSAVTYNGTPLELGGGITPSGSLPITENGTYDVTEYAEAVVNVSGGVVGTEVIIVSDTMLMGDFAKAIFPSWPNGFDPNSFYVCFWNGLFDGSTPIYSQVGYIAFWTNENGDVDAQANTCQRYRDNWIGLVGIVNNWDAHTSVGDKYTWYKIT